MKVINVSELKAHLSKYLRLASRGTRIVVNVLDARRPSSDCRVVARAHGTRRRHWSGAQLNRGVRDVSLIPAVIALALVAASPAWAQYAYPYGLDPYKPTDAAFLRDYGGTLVAQTPLLELRKLDPYVPSHAALIRQIGALPLWGVWYGPFLPGRAPMRSRLFAPTRGTAAGVGASAPPAFVDGDRWLMPALPLPGQPRLGQIPRREVREDRASIPGR